MVELLLKNGADPNRAYWSMSRPVRTAANHNGKDIFRMLVKAGASYTLYETVQLGFLKLTRELLEQNENAINALEEGSLPIVQAADDVKMTRLLLKHGADPNARDSRGVTPLMAASQNGNKEVIETLLANGAEKDIFFAIGSQDRELVAKMLREDPDCHQSEFVTPLIWAVVSADRVIVEDLLRAGANPNETQDRWMQDSPLVAAVAHSYDHLVPVLLNAGADVDPSTAYRWSIPLVAAIRWGSYKGVEMLLEAGADPNVSDSEDIAAPLGWVAFVGDLVGAKMLLDAGASKLSRSQALCIAAQRGQSAIVELLGTLDTDLEYPHPQGTPLQQAKSNKHADCVLLLNELREIHALPRKERDTILGARAEFLNLLCMDDGDSLDALITKQPELVDRDLVRNELFHHATGNRQTKVEKRPMLSVVEVLIKHGVPWTIQSAVACDRFKEVRTLARQRGALKVGLHAAAKFNNVRAIRFLLEQGVDVNVKQSWGTALHEAVRYESLEAAEYLIKRGASVNATDQYLNTPRSLCYRSNESLDAIRTLLETHGAKS